MLDKIRNLLIVIPSIITVIGVISKIFYNLFMESVRYEYDDEAIQQSKSSIIFRALLGLVFIIDIIGLGLLFNQTITKFVNGKLSSSNTNNAVGITSTIISVIIIISLIVLGYIFSKVRKTYILKLNQNKYKKINKLILILNIINTFFWGAASLIFIYTIYYMISIGIDIKSNNLGELIFESALTGIDYYGLIICGIVFILCISLFMLCISFYGIIDKINKDVTYYIIRRDDVILSKCYLDYIGYYLVIDKGVERYIKKSDVIEIKKVRGNLKSNIKKEK